MVAVSLDSGLSSLQIGKECSYQRLHGAVTDELPGLIRVYKDGHVERSQIVPCVTTRLAPELGVLSRDTIIDRVSNIWARFYVPTTSEDRKPLIVYFHGGGFCVGSSAWSCYHEFLSKLAAKTDCLVMSVNYRLAPENPLPAAYEDGITALMWLKKLSVSNCDSGQSWWTKQCNFSNIFLAGDSAGANIVYNVISMVGSDTTLNLKGMIMIQPFFGGEARTDSEKNLVQSPRSALSLAASDTYWRLALPRGANRDHRWCNPMAKLKDGGEIIVQLPMMVCISEMDILRDRNLEFVNSDLVCKGKKKRVVHKGVGHAFQILSKSQIAQTRTIEMMSEINDFISGCYIST
ncbi:probable carboxylesterase 6 [Mercurialis annua]|uniref:probable carboxylesterase 6 n=1 Tax=Mercurialis annua TaxID=3986 RepID=UPI00215F527C|nr:probable carboxylesterase 6 [Mercurialis annua]